jgi:hypothetical protein
MKRTKLRLKGISTTAELKDDIQNLVRDIVIKRDGGCILRVLPGHKCNGFANDGHLILQADHLLTRANSGTYSDTRLIVCICKGAHGWKHWHESEYNKLVKTILPKERVELWEKCEEEMHAHKTHKMDWALEKIVLERELSTYQ